MTDKDFCKIETAISGEEIDKVEQITHYTFTGRELKEYLEQAFVIYTVMQAQPEKVCDKCLGKGGHHIYDSFLYCKVCKVQKK